MIDVGDTFSAKVAGTAPDGTAYVKVGNNTVTIGPVTCREGTTVRLRYLGEDGLNRPTTVNLAICLTEDVLADDYEEYIKNRLIDYLPDRVPKPGKTTYAKIEEIRGPGIGVTTFGGKRVLLGPVCEDPGTIVKIRGVTDSCAEILTESARGNNYDTILKIISKQHQDLPVSVGDEFITVISDIEGETLLASVESVPIAFSDDSAAMGQKIKGRVTGFYGTKATAEIVKKHDEDDRIKLSGYEPRTDWLRQAGFDDDPFREFTKVFVGSEEAVLLQEPDFIRDALIAEAMRLALQDKADTSEEAYSRTHILGLRHWVIHKLATVLGHPEETEDDWFKDVLSERTGPTMTFLGDVLPLANGYYAPGPTRAIMMGDSEAVLVSGVPSRQFLKKGLELEFRGISRIIKNTDEASLLDPDLPVQGQEDYTGENEIGVFNETYLREFIQNRQLQDWMPQSDWVAYTGNQGYDFDWGDDPYRVEQNGSILSLWKIPVEYGADEYQLKIEPKDTRDVKTVQVPAQYHKQICLVLDNIGGRPRRTELTQLNDEARLSCDFPPPRAQFRWLNALGARWEESHNNRIHWRLDTDDAPSVEKEFRKLPVTIKNTIG